MLEQLVALEQSWLAGFLKTSFVVYPVVSALHIAGVGALLTSVILMDAKLLGAFASIEQAAFVAIMRRTAFAGFALAVLSGALLFTIRASHYAQTPLFWLKLSLIVLAVLNAFAFMALSGTQANGQALGRGLKTMIALSLTLWPAVVLCGRFLGFA